MNRIRRIFKYVMLSLAFIMTVLVVLAFALPAVSITVGDVTTNFYFFTLIMGSTGSTSLMVSDAFTGVLLAVLAISSPYVILYAKSKVTHSIGIACLLSAACWAFAIFFQVTNTYSTMEGISYIGIIFIFIEAIVSIVYLLLSLAFDIIGEKLMNGFHVETEDDAKTTEAKLEEAKNLFDKQLITEVEYDEIRKTILGKIH